MQLTINGLIIKIVAEPQMPLLWVIRDYVNLTGTKYGCGISLCGACTVHLDGKAVRSCSIPAAAAANKKITTIEGLSVDGSHSFQIAWSSYPSSFTIGWSDIRI